MKSPYYLSPGYLHKEIMAINKNHASLLLQGKSCVIFLLLPTSAGSLPMVLHCIQHGLPTRVRLFVWMTLKWVFLHWGFLLNVYHRVFVLWPSCISLGEKGMRIVSYMSHSSYVRLAEQYNIIHCLPCFAGIGFVLLMFHFSIRFCLSSGWVVPTQWFYSNFCSSAQSVKAFWCPFY